MTEAPRFEQLDTTLVGETLMRLPAITAMLRHTSLQSTLGYIAEEVGGPCGCSRRPGNLGRRPVRIHSPAGIWTWPPGDCHSVKGGSSKAPT